ncbi:hypothetical protein [Schaalia cardiffensis]
MSNLIVRRKNEIVEQQELEATPLQYIEVRLTDIDAARAKNILAQAVQQAGLAKDAVKALSKDTIYVLDIPKKIQEGLESGKFTFMQKKDTGESLAAIYEVVDGKKSLFANLTTKEVQLANERAVHDLGQGVQQLALQQQMAVLLNEIEDVHKIVALIEQGQRDDRFAEIKSGYDQLRLALKTVDEEKRNRMIENAIQTITSGSSKIQLALTRRIADFEAVPSSDIGVYLKMLTSYKSYIDKKDAEYDGIGEYFEYYETASRLLVYASLMEDEPDRVKEIIRLHGEFIGSLEAGKLKTISKLHPEESFDAEWYMNPQGYIEETTREYIYFIEGNYDYMSIEATGAQLLEVLDDEETGQEE